MCSTASVQVCLDAGEQGSGPGSVGWRWRLLHALGPVLVAAFANSPLREGRPTGWKSTRQAIWARLDPCRTRPPAGAVPPALAGNGQGRSLDADPRAAWVDYALSAEVMCVRRPGAQPWTAPAGLTFRSWLRGGRRAAAHPRRPLLPPVHAVPAGPAARPPGVPGHRRPGRRRLDRARRRGHRAARRRGRVGAGDGRRGSPLAPGRPRPAGATSATSPARAAGPAGTAAARGSGRPGTARPTRSSATSAWPASRPPRRRWAGWMPRPRSGKRSALSPNATSPGTDVPPTTASTRHAQAASAYEHRRQLLREGIEP